MITFLFVQNHNLKTNSTHPFYVSVTEIEYNDKENSIEISCKVFNDDFEKTLKQNCNCVVDLIYPKDKNSVDDLINNYIQKHLSIQVNGNKIDLKYLGYEKNDDSILSYFKIDGIAAVNKIDIVNSILYDYKNEQINIVHVTVKGNRKSSKLTNPDDKITLEF